MVGRNVSEQMFRWCKLPLQWSPPYGEGTFLIVTTIEALGGVCVDILMCRRVSVHHAWPGSAMRNRLLGYQPGGSVIFERARTCCINSKATAQNPEVSESSLVGRPGRHVPADARSGTIWELIKIGTMGGGVCTAPCPWVPPRRSSHSKARSPRYLQRAPDRTASEPAPCLQRHAQMQREWRSAQ
jgi:hypothetical protein